MCYTNRVVIPPSSPLVQQLLHKHHNTIIGGYSGVIRTFKRLSRQFYWPAMHKMVADYVSRCDTCQREKSQTMSPAGLLQPLPVPDQLWEDVSMDFVDGLPKLDGYTTIMMVVDRLSNSAYLFHKRTLTPPLRWLQNLSHQSRSSMVSHVLFLAIESRYFSVIFGRNSGKSVALNFVGLQRIILKPMVKPKFSTDALNTFCGVSSNTDPSSGALSYLAQSIGIISPSMQARAGRLSKLFMAGHLRH